MFVSPPQKSICVQAKMLYTTCVYCSKYRKSELPYVNGAELKKVCTITAKEEVRLYTDRVIILLIFCLCEYSGQKQQQQQIVAEWLAFQDPLSGVSLNPVIGHP